METSPKQKNFLKIIPKLYSLEKVLFLIYTKYFLKCKQTSADLVSLSTT